MPWRGVSNEYYPAAAARERRYRAAPKRRGGNPGRAAGHWSGHSRPQFGWSSCWQVRAGLAVASLNVANALGAWAGGVSIGAGFGLLSPAWAGFGLTAAGLLLFVVMIAWRSPAPHRPRLG